MEQTANATEEQLGAKEQEELGELTPEEESQLSKVLFPDTHTESIELLGKKRDLRPLTIKYGKILFTQLGPLHNKIAVALASGTEEQEKKDEEDFAPQTVDALLAAAVTMAEFYGWEDVKKAAEEEELPLGEIQLLANIQTELNGANDFLLGPLRVIVRMMKIQELVQVRLANISITLRSLDNGTAASTNSSPDTQVDK